jgi:hypothetical protein
MQNDINNPYLLKSAEVFKTELEELSIMRLGNLMPFLARPLHDIAFRLTDIRKFLTKLIPSLGNYIQEMPAEWLLNRVQDVLTLRTQSTSNVKSRVDLLQLMIDSSTEGKVKVSQLI